MFKKVVVLSGLSLVLASSLFAEMLLGVSSVKPLDEKSQAGISLDLQASWFHPKSLSGLGLGGYISSDFFTLDETSSDLNSPTGINMGVGLLVDYSFDGSGVPLDVFAGAGYGVGQLATSYDGLNYKVGSVYRYNKKNGIGVQYKHNDVKFATGGNTGDLDIVGVFWKYSK